MSFAIALENNPETIANLENLKVALSFLQDFTVADLTYKEIILSPEIIDNMYDWVEDIHKILTDYSLFSDNIEN